MAVGNCGLKNTDNMAIDVVIAIKVKLDVVHTSRGWNSSVRLE